MQLLRTIPEMRAWRASQSGTLGFVPTMGALHKGHVRLIDAAVAANDLSLVSIFVNPTQFNDPKDCATYPTPIEADLQYCRSAGVSAVFLPTFDDMYADDYRFSVRENRDSRILEGAFRPGHFDGVLTVVLKLLLLARADCAYFGEKDWQQLQLIRGMAEAFFLDTRICPVATIREPDGLAMSSRNIRLSATARTIAPAFAAILQSAGTCDEACSRLEAAGFVVEYVTDWDGRRLGAVRLDGVRLIDNFPLAQCAGITSTTERL